MRITEKAGSGHALFDEIILRETLVPASGQNHAVAHLDPRASVRAMTRRYWNHAAIAAAACLASLLMLFSVSCSSSSVGSDGLPSRLPEIHLAGSSATPPHNMPSYDYPFDSSGRYVSDWAAEGERRAGRSARATSADSSRWSSSHGGASTRSKTASSSKSKSGTSAKAKSRAGRSYTVKKGDTLSHIAGRHGTSVAKIKSANGMKSDFLSIGRVLRIP